MDIELLFGIPITDLVWYASYGSNMLSSRFYCYIEGGMATGSLQPEAGCADKSLPLVSKNIILRHNLYFAKVSKKWDGGVAFIDPNINPLAETFGRMYLIKKSQFAEIVRQENRLPNTPIIDYELAERKGSYVFDEKVTFYNSIIYSGKHSDIPILTFSNSAVLKINKPSKKYLVLLVAGILEAMHLESNAIANYFVEKQGVNSHFEFDDIKNIAKFINLTVGFNLSMSSDILNTYISFFSNIKLTQPQKSSNDQINDAIVVGQMVLGKILNLKKILEGVEVSFAESQSELIIDSSVISAVVRNIYETACMFNIVYIQPRNPDEQLILYNLWVHAGLSLRKRYQIRITNQISKDQADADEIKMKRLREEILNTQLFSELDSKNQNKVLAALKDKIYQFKFERGSFYYMSWEKIGSLAGLNEEIATEYYSFLSLHTHPSNVSVFQYQAMALKGNLHFAKFAETITSWSLFFISGFIADYCKVYSQAFTLYSELNEIEKGIIDFYNVAPRSKQFSIDGSYTFGAS